MSLALLGLLALPCSAAPGALDFERLAAAAGASGFAAPQASGVLVPASLRVPLTRTLLTAREAETERVDLSGLLDRHLSQSSSFNDRVGRHRVALTLDQTEPDGAWLTVTPPGAQTRMVLIEAGMNGRWSAGGRNYKVGLDINIFRARLNNVIVIRDADSDEVLWSKRISELMSTSYFAGEEVRIGGRSYRIFLAHMPDESHRPAIPSKVLGICLIYDEVFEGRHVRYRTFRVLLDPLRRPEGVTMSLMDGERALLKAAPDGSSLEISR